MRRAQVCFGSKADIRLAQGSEIARSQHQGLRATQPQALLGTRADTLAKAVDSCFPATCGGVVTVLKEILDWSQDRPAWQRDALRRLVLNGVLTDADIRELSEICKAAHGLASPQDPIPLTSEHTPSTSTGAGQVTLVSIFHHRGVNALAEGQTLKFGQGLTVVYGDNAAGKTGYIRILKSACRARGKEEILGNVISGGTPHKPVVAIKYKVGTGPGREWAGDGEDDYISRVSVFDTSSAAVYLTAETDVAFRPFGLDLFDGLVRACNAVRTRLEYDQRTLGATVVKIFEAPEGTAVAKLQAGLSSLTKPETVQALARLSPDEQARLTLLEKSLLDLQVNDPDKLALQLTIRAARIRTFTRHVEAIDTALSADSVSTLLQVKSQVKQKEEEARRLRAVTFPEGSLAGTGTERWSQMWESARCFSEEHAYAGRHFPVVDEGSRCVLCQQGLGDASQRLRHFEAFITSNTERELRETKGRLASLQGRLVDLRTTNETANETIREIRIEHESLADKLSNFLVASETRRQAVLNVLLAGQESFDFPVVPSLAQDANALAGQLDQRIRTLKGSSNQEQKKLMTSELQELRARVLLAKHEREVLAEIERKKKLAAYQLCLNDTRTQAITQKSTAVTKSVVTHKLKSTFQEELKRLNFSHVEVELKDSGGEHGILYHKLILTRAPGAQLPRVVSEGEQRCLSIAAFFAELSTADDPSAIVFDDPVSSLDYRWRDDVARRLVEEAKVRQVIVFTHDVVFLLALREYAEQQGVSQLDQHIRQLSRRAGVCADELPWVALPVKKKIGYLKNEWQSADRLFGEGHQSAYEKEAKALYGLLREAWERALEEVLLNGVVERFRPSVQTKQVGKIADITAEDCKTLEVAMTKSSRWLHDQAAAARAAVPEPAVLKADIEELERWVAAVRERRG